VRALTMRVGLVLLGLLVACSRAPAAGPVLLFVAPVGDGQTTRLFQLGPEGEPSSVAALDEVEVDTVVTSASGQCALVSGGSPSVVRLAPRLEVEPVNTAARVRALAISDDCRTFVFGHGDDTLLIHQGRRAEVVRVPGRHMYRTALSADGTRLAFSAMDQDCASGTAQATCPVRLFGIDLARSFQPRLLVDPGVRLAYDPFFEDAAGTSLLFMTDAEDHGDACRGHVNRCVYALHRVTFDATASQTGQLVQTDAVHGRRLADGTLVHRRRLNDTWMSQQQLVGGKPVGPRLSMWDSHFDPGGRWFASSEPAPERPGRETLRIFGRDGRPAGPGVPDLGVRAGGWLVRRLPAGKHALGAWPRAQARE
jgi:hypothetical protein